MAEFSREDVFAAIDRLAPQFGVDPRFAKALTTAENTGSGNPASSKTSYDGGAVSSANAMGVMQVIPSTARGLQKAGLLPATWKHDPKDLDSQVSAGLATIKDMSSRLKNPGDIFELAAYYNGGTNGLKTYQSGRLDALAPETQDYFRKINIAAPHFGITVNHMTPQQIEQAAAGQRPPVATGAPSMNSGSSSSTRVTSTQYDQEALSNFMRAAQGFISPGGTLDQTSAAITAAGVDRTKAFQAYSSAIVNTAAEEGGLAAAKSMRESAAATQRLGILRNSNLDPNAADNEQMRATEEINRTELAMAPLRDEINERMSVSFFDNPLTWLVNQTRLPGLVDTYNGYVRKQNAATDRYKTLSAIANTQQQISTNTQADEILQEGRAAANVAAAQAQEKLSHAKLQLAGADARDAMQAAQVAGQGVQIAGQVAAMTKQTVSESESESERAAAKRQAQIDLENVNKLLQAAGRTALTPEQFKAMNATTKSQLIERSTKNKFGDAFSDSIGFIDINGIRAGGGNGIATWVSNVLGAARKSADAAATQAKAMGKPLTEKQLDSELAVAMDRIQSQYQSEMAVDMSKASDNNPAKLDYVNLIKRPEFANSGVTQFLQKFGPTSANPIFMKVEERAILDSYVARIQAKEITPAQAAEDISKFYRLGADAQAKNTQYQLFGMYKPDKTYLVTLPDWQITKAVDLGNPTQVENALTLRTAQKIAEQRIVNTVPFGSMDIFGLNRRPEQDALQQARQNMEKPQ